MTEKHKIDDYANVFVVLEKGDGLNRIVLATEDREAVRPYQRSGEYTIMQLNGFIVDRPL